MAQYYSSSNVMNLPSRSDFEINMNSVVQSPPPVPPKTVDTRQRLFELNRNQNQHQQRATIDKNGDLIFSAPPPPPFLPPSGKSHPQQQCDCCPYGYHIVVDFVQFAEDEAKQIKKAKKRMKRSVEQYAEQQRLRRLAPVADDGGDNRALSVYENFRPRQQQTTSTAPAAFSPSSVFSDSLENVMSDFDDALAGGGGGQQQQRSLSAKDYSSDYGERKSFTKYESPAVKASVGRNDGYASDCGYAVPKISTAGHSATAGSTVNGNGMKQHNAGYTSSEYYAAPSVLSSSMLSDSVSSLSSVNSSSLHNTSADRPALAGLVADDNRGVEAYEQRRLLVRTGDGSRRVDSSEKSTTGKGSVGGGANGVGVNYFSPSSSDNKYSSSTFRDYYESDSGLLSPSRNQKFTTSTKFYEHFNNNNNNNNTKIDNNSNRPSATMTSLMAPPLPPPRPPRVPNFASSSLSGQLAANMENLANVINRIKPPPDSPSPRKFSSGNVYEAMDSRSAQSPGSSSNSSGLQIQAAREQMAVSLDRMKDLEDQVKSIPIMNIRLKNLHNEKSQLSLELDEAKRKLRERHQQQHPLLSSSKSAVVTPTTPVTPINENLSYSSTSIGNEQNATRSGAEYATALARAMSAVSKNVAESLPPAIPQRTKSIDRMREVGNYSRTSAFGSNSPILLRTPSGNIMNLDEFHSVRRHGSTTTSYRSNYGRDEDYVSDSELALGDRSTERFASLRRSRQLLRHSSGQSAGLANSTPVGSLYQNPAVRLAPPPPPPTRQRFSSVGAADSGDEYWPLSGGSTWMRRSSRDSEETRNEQKSSVEIQETKKSKPLTRDVGVNHVGPSQRSVAVQHQLDETAKSSVLLRDEKSAKSDRPFCLAVSMATNTSDDLKCDECETRKKRKFSSNSTYTGPLPQPKPCSECEELHLQLSAAKFRPISYSVGTTMSACNCERCVITSSKTYANIECQTNSSRLRSRDAEISVDFPVRVPPCNFCTERSRRKFSDSSTSPVVLLKTSFATNTESPEVANRKVNTDVVEFRSSSTSMENSKRLDQSTTVDRSILQKSGYWKDKITLTQQPVMFSVGFNTDLIGGSYLSQNQSINGDREKSINTDIASNMDIDFDHLCDELTQLRGTQPTCRLCTRRANWIDFSDKSTETEYTNLNMNTNTTSFDEDTFGGQQRKHSSTKSVGSLTDKVVGKSVFVSTEKLSTSDRAIDCSAKTRDTGTVTVKSRYYTTGTNTPPMVVAGNSNFARGVSEDTINYLTSEYEASENVSPLRASKSVDTVEIVGTQQLNFASGNNDSFHSENVHQEQARKSMSGNELQKPSTFVTSNSVTVATDKPSSVAIHTTRKISDSLLNESVSFLSESNESVMSTLSREGENIISPLIDDDDEEDEDDFERNEKLCQQESVEQEKFADDRTEEDQYYNDEELEEFGAEGSSTLTPTSASSTKEKFDFTKPRATRAFALSKAAATKKLLMTDQQQTPNQKSTHNVASSHSYGAQSADSANFRRNSVQSKSVRVESKNKGDHLAYITDRKQTVNGGGVKNGRKLPPTGLPVSKKSVGLKGKVQIKKPLNERKSTGCSVPAAAAMKLLSRPSTAAPSGGDAKSSSLLLKSSVSAPENLVHPKDIVRKSLLLEDEREEAADTLGPLPSELARSWSIGAKTPSHGYDNPAVSADTYDDLPSSVIHVGGDLVSNVIENLPGETPEDGATSSSGSSNGESSRSSSDSEESNDEGSYATDGKISNKCEISPPSQQFQRAHENSSTKQTSPSKESTREEVYVKFVMPETLKQACELVNRSLLKPNEIGQTEKLECALQFLQHEWLKAAARKAANARYVEEFLDAIESFSRQLLHKVVNMCDQNENTVLHYAVSHGNFDIVSLLLDTKVCNLNRPNKAGYTPVMLAALCPIGDDTDRVVIQRLFQMGDVNIKASQHGQTALMLAVSHGKMETTKLLLDAGAGVNIQDEDGSTALMCAAEHGHKEIVRLLLSHPEIDASMADYDGSTALSIAVDNGHKDIGVLIYAHLNYARNVPSLKSQSAPVWC